MQFTTIKSPLTLTALTQQVFDTQGAKTAVIKQAHAALRAANPHWGEHAKLPAGTLVIVPQVPGLNATASPPPMIVSPAVIELLKQVLADAQAVLENSSDSTIKEIETSVSLAKSRRLAGLVKEAPELRTRLAQINEQAKVHLKQIQTDKLQQLQGLAQLEKDLGSLIS